MKTFQTENSEKDAALILVTDFLLQKIVIEGVVYFPFCTSPPLFQEVQVCFF